MCVCVSVSDLCVAFCLSLFHAHTHTHTHAEERRGGEPLDCAFVRERERENTSRQKREEEKEVGDDVEEGSSSSTILRGCATGERRRGTSKCSGLL